MQCASVTTEQEAVATWPLPLVKLSQGPGSYRFLFCSEASAPWRPNPIGNPSARRSVNAQGVKIAC